MLDKFLRSHCRVAHRERIRFIELFDAFRAQLPKADVDFWPRTRVVWELSRGSDIQLAIDASGTAWLIGVDLKQPRAWTVENGRVANA